MFSLICRTNLALMVFAVSCNRCHLNEFIVNRDTNSGINTNGYDEYSIIRTRLRLYICLNCYSQDYFLGTINVHEEVNLALFCF